MPLVRDLATALGGQLHGNGALEVTRATEPALAGQKDIAVALSQMFVADLAASKAQVALVGQGADWEDFGLEAVIEVPRGRLAMAHLTQVLDPNHLPTGQIHQTAVIDPSAKISNGVSIGAFSVIGAGCVIGSDTTIGAHVTVAAEAKIGGSSIIGDGCRIAAHSILGDRVRLHVNVSIGGDGFSFVTAEPAHVEVARETLGEAPAPKLDDPSWQRIHSLGGVVIGNDVEVGSNTTIDAGTLRPTRIGAGTKIDNLVQVGHNVVIGEHCLLCAQVGVAGSAIIGDRTVLGGKSGISDNTKIGADVVIGGGSVVLSNVPDGRVMLGYPAVKLRTHIESYKALRRLPRVLSRLVVAKTGFKRKHD